MTKTILIVDDEEDIRNLISGILEDEGFEIRTASHSDQAYTEIQGHSPDVVVLDIWLQGSKHDGLEILEHIKKDKPDLPVVMISGHGTIETAVTSIKMGAYDFIEKPFKSDRLILMIQRALENAALRQENAYLKKQSYKAVELNGKSPIIQSVTQIIKRVAPANSRVLLSGEPGCGKNIAARMIHNLSGRAQSPFKIVDCANLEATNLEHELFGDHKAPDSKGVFEIANGGTILFDEISDMPLITQGKVVRLLQDQKIKSSASNQLIDLDIRFIAATNRDLSLAIKSGTFREDLYYRLNVVPIQIPPLRERIQDIPVLLERFSEELSSETGLQPKAFTENAIGTMQAYDWPGNIRQLKNVVEWIMIMFGNSAIEKFDIEHLPPEVNASLMNPQGSNGQGKSINFAEHSLREAREIFEREYLLSQIRRFDGNISKTAKFIGMERSALHRKLKSLDILNTDKDNETSNDEASKEQQRA